MLRIIPGMPNFNAIRQLVQAEANRRERMRAEEDTRRELFAQEAETRRDQKFRDWAHHYVPHFFPDRGCRLHEYLFGRLGTFDTERNRREACLAPRGYAKSTIASRAYPLYVACEEKEPYTLLVGDGKDQSQKNLNVVRAELETNPRIAADYPDAFGPGPTWNVKMLTLRNGVSIEAVNNGGKIRGTTHRHNRPSLIICDDMDNDVSVESEKQRDKSWKWLTRALMPARAKGGNMFVLGTALHRSDTMQRLKTTPGWLFRMYAALICEPDNDDLWAEWEKISIQQTLDYSQSQDDNVEFVDLARQFFDSNRDEMEAGSEVLWEPLETLYDLMSYKLADPWGFRSEKQGIPTSSQSAEWREEYFPDKIHFDNWPDMRVKVMACDPSKGATDTSDFSAWVMLGLGHDGLLYVDADIQRRDIERICSDGISLAQAFKPDAITIEGNSFAGLVLSWQMMVQQMPDAHLVPPPLELHNTIKKHVRIRGLSPYLTEFKFRFKSNSRGVDILLDQLREFPNARYDDGPDALKMAMTTLEWQLGDDNEGAGNYDAQAIPA